jgi:hypothetical protein
MIRELLDPKKIKIEANHKEYERVIEGLKIAKSKMIPQDSLIIFDEAHFNRSDYQQLFRETVFLEDKKNKDKPAKKVLLMSATFRNKPFSITSSFPIESREVNQFSTNTKFSDPRYKDFDEKLTNSQTLLFVENVKKLNLLPIKQVPYVIVDETNVDTIEGVSEGMPPGSIIIADSKCRIGLTLKCQIVIDTAMEEVENVGGGFVKEVTSQSYSEANLVQGRGRGGRREGAIYYTISTQTEDAGARPNTLSFMIEAGFGKVTNLQRQFFKPKVGMNSKEIETYNKNLVEVIRAAFAFPDK